MCTIWYVRVRSESIWRCRLFFSKTLVSVFSCLIAWCSHTLSPLSSLLLSSFIEKGRGEGEANYILWPDLPPPPSFKTIHHLPTLLFQRGGHHQPPFTTIGGHQSGELCGWKGGGSGGVFLGAKPRMHVATIPIFRTSAYVKFWEKKRTRLGTGKVQHSPPHTPRFSFLSYPPPLFLNILIGDRRDPISHNRVWLLSCTTVCVNGCVIGVWGRGNEMRLI